MSTSHFQTESFKRKEKTSANEVGQYSRQIRFRRAGASGKGVSQEARGRRSTERRIGKCVQTVSWTYALFGAPVVD